MNCNEELNNLYYLLSKDIDSELELLKQECNKDKYIMQEMKNLKSMLSNKYDVNTLDDCIYSIIDVYCQEFFKAGFVKGVKLMIACDK